MFGEIKKAPEDNLDGIITRILLEMEVYGPDSDEFPKLLDALERLEKIKVEKRTPRALFGVSPDTVILTAGKLCGILLIIAYEQKHVMSPNGLKLALQGN